MASVSALASSLQAMATSSSPVDSAPSKLDSRPCNCCGTKVIKALLCSRCKCSYCSAACQRKDWKSHKKTCKVYYPPADPLSKPFELPDSILSHILSHLLSDPCPPTHLSTRGFSPTSLLLISHSFTALVLPHLYRTITLSRPSHFSTFFDPYTGIFLTRPDLWAHVERIVFHSHIRPPIYPDSETGEYIVPLDYPPSRRRIQEICVVPSSSSDGKDADWLSEPGAKELLTRIRTDPRERADAEEGFAEGHVADSLVHQDGTPYTVQEWVARTWPDAHGDWEAAIDASIAAEVRELVQEERETFFDELVFAASPGVVRVSWPSARRDLPLKDACPPDEAVAVETLVVHHSGRGKDEWEDLYTYAQQVGVSCGVEHVRMVGFGRERWEEFKRHVEERERSVKPDWIERWTWEGESEEHEVLRVTENLRVKFKPPASPPT